MSPQQEQHISQGASRVEQSWTEPVLLYRGERYPEEVKIKPMPKLNPQLLSQEKPQILDESTSS